MSETKRKVPKLRFPGFTEDWEQRKLGELFDRYESRVETPHDGYWRLGLRSHCKGTFHTYVEPGSELETSDMNIVKEGNFILNITFAWELALAITDNDDDGKLVSHRFPQFKPKRNLLIKFFKHTLSNNKFKHHLQLASPGGAGRNKVLKINEMLKFELLFPNMEEQLAITKILEDFDNLITLHQRKLGNLKLKKKALLQKLFPKNGEQLPELRFPGFTDAWEQRKLGDYLSIPIKEQLEVNSSNDLLTVKLNLGGVELGANRDTLSLGSTTYYKRLAGQFIYGKQNFFNGSMGIIPEELDGKGSSGDVPSLNISNILPEFLYTYVSRESYWRPKEASASGTGSKRIHEATLLSFDIAVPDEQEQKLIATCINGITNLITLHQRKLEHLQLQKKALLQQMFV